MSTEQSRGAGRLGRRLKSDEDRKSETLRFRVREDLKRRLEAEAASFGRSVSEEAEKRLENSFKLENLNRLVYGSGPAGDYLRNIVRGLLAIHEYELSPGQRVGSSDWQSSDATRAAIRAMMKVLDKELLPPPRTPAQVAAAVDPISWNSPREEYYKQTIGLMEAMATEMTKRMLGKSDDGMKISDPIGAVEH